MTRTRYFVGAASILAALILSSPTIAQTQQQQIDACMGKDNASADVKIGGCTALVRSGKYSGNNLARVLNLRGKAYHDQNDNDHAIADYDQAIRADPKFAPAYVNRGEAYQAKRDYAQAIKDYAQGLSLNPKNATAWAYQGDSYYAAGQPEQAIKSFAESIKYDPNWMWPYNDRGELYLDRDNFELALADFDQVVRLSPTYAMGWNNRCRALALSGQRLEQALNDCNEALKINPGFRNHMAKSGVVSAIGDRGLVHLKAGRFDAAIGDFDKALEITPESAEVLYSRGVAKKGKGDTGGVADIVAAKQAQADIAEKMARVGVK